jgi:UPF0176 protein
MLVVAALYKFADLPDFEALHDKLEAILQENKILGTLIIAAEGLNGTVCGTREAINALKAFLLADTRFAGIEYKEAQAQQNPFRRAKVKIKSEIVTMGQPMVSPGKNPATYVSPAEWNRLLDDPEVIVLDVRNDYEVAIGTFAGSENPKTQTFREFPEYVSQKLSDKRDKKIAMSCTGGIRCEKAGAYLKQLGFAEVYSLKGGILQYLQDCPQTQSKWQGECYVFDDRVSVNHDLTRGQYVWCHGCKNPLHPDEMQSEQYEAGVSCPKCFDLTSEAQKASARERHKQMALAKNRGVAHITLGA